jgi:hypothetical protein
MCNCVQLQRGSSTIYTWLDLKAWRSSVKNSTQKWSTEGIFGDPHWVIVVGFEIIRYELYSIMVQMCPTSWNGSWRILTGFGLGISRYELHSKNVEMRQNCEKGSQRSSVVGQYSKIVQTCRNGEKDPCWGGVAGMGSIRYELTPSFSRPFNLYIVLNISPRSWGQNAP